MSLCNVMSSHHTISYLPTMFRTSIRGLHCSARRGVQLNHMKVAQRNLQGLTIGVPKEVTEGEGRVAMTPPHVVKLIKAGASIKIESGAGDIAGFPDSTFTSAGAQIASVEDVWKSKVVAKVSSFYSPSPSYFWKI